MIEAPAPLLAINAETRKPYDSRVKDGASARALVQQVSKEDAGRSKDRALTKALLNGAAPFSEKYRRDNGLNWTANLNFMEGRAAVDSARVPYYQLFSAVKHYADCATAYQPEHPEHERWGDTITKHFDALLKGWDQFDWHIQNSQYWMLVEGWAPLFFPKVSDWRFRSLPSASIKVEKDAPSCIDSRHSHIAISSKYKIHELWEFIKDEEAAKALGWNVKMVQDTIIATANGTFSAGSPRNSDSWEEWERRLTNNDLYWSNQSGEVSVSWLWVQELSGKVSQFIVTDSELPEPGLPNEKRPDTFLFKSVELYEHYGQALVVFFQNTGDGTWHSVKGMAYLGYKHWDVSNRLKCQSINNAFLRSTMMIQPKDMQSMDKLQLMVRGDAMIFPAGAELLQLTAGSDIEGVLAVDRMLSNHLANNLGVFNQRSMSRDDGRGEMPTATQVQMQVQKEATLNQGQITLTYATMDKLYAEMLRRAVLSSDSEAKKFREACYDDGVPERALKEMEYVRANRASGYGSAQSKMLVLEQLEKVLPMLPEEGKVVFADMLISATAGVDKVDKLNPKLPQPNMDQGWAQMEDLLLWQGTIPPVISGQNNVAHLQVHLETAKQKLGPMNAAVEAGEPVDPQAMEEAMRYVEALVPHVEAHLAPIRSDPSRKHLAKQFDLILRDLVAFSGQLVGALRNAQRDMEIAAQEEQNAVALGAMDQAKLASVQQEMILKREKTANDIQLKNLKAANSVRLANFKAAQNSQLNTATTLEEIRRGRAIEAAGV